MVKHSQTFEILPQQQLGCVPHIPHHLSTVSSKQIKTQVPMIQSVWTVSACSSEHSSYEASKPQHPLKWGLVEAAPDFYFIVNGCTEGHSWLLVSTINAMCLLFVLLNVHLQPSLCAHWMLFFFFFFYTKRQLGEVNTPWRETTLALCSTQSRNAACELNFNSLKT